jgi:hypothetical protein
MGEPLAWAKTNPDACAAAAAIAALDTAAPSR